MTIKGILQVLQTVKYVVESCDPAGGDECRSSVMYCTQRSTALDLLENMWAYGLKPLYSAQPGWLMEQAGNWIFSLMGNSHI